MRDQGVSADLRFVIKVVVEIEKVLLIIFIIELFNSSGFILKA